MPHCKLCLPKCARKSSQAATVVVEGVHILQLPFSHSLKGLLCPFFPPPQWLQMVKIRHKIGLLWFHELFQGIVISVISVSSDGMCFRTKICQTVAGISVTSQFPEFLNLIFGGFLPFGPCQTWDSSNEVKG